jgi:hypothetical protein
MFRQKFLLLNRDGIYLINQQQEMSFQKTNTVKLCAKEPFKCSVKVAGTKAYRTNQTFILSKPNVKGV